MLERELAHTHHAFWNAFALLRYELHDNVMGFFLLIVAVCGHFRFQAALFMRVSMITRVTCTAASLSQFCTGQIAFVCVCVCVYALKSSMRLEVACWHVRTAFFAAAHVLHVLTSDV